MPDRHSGDADPDLELAIAFRMIAELRIRLGLDRDGSATAGRIGFLAHEYARKAREAGAERRPFRARRRAARRLRQIERAIVGRAVADD